MEITSNYFLAANDKNGEIAFLWIFEDENIETSLGNKTATGLMKVTQIPSGVEQTLSIEDARLKWMEGRSTGLVQINYESANNFCKSINYKIKSKSDSYSATSDSNNNFKKEKNIIARNLFDIENRNDISREEKANRIINLFAGVCAGVAVQPIPFADIFVLTPLQVYMGERLSAIWGIPANQSSVSDLIKDLFKIVGMGLMAQQLAIGAYKTFLPFLGAVTTVPLVYGLTFAIGNVLSEMYKRRSEGKSKLSDEEVNRIWKESFEKGKQDYKKGKEINDDDETPMGVRKR